MHSTDTLRVNICITPPLGTAREIVALANRLPESGQHFKVDGETRHPHLTSFMGLFSVNQVDELLHRLDSLPKAGRISCSAYGLTVSSNYYFELGYNRTPELDKLQWSVAAAIAALRATDRSRPDPGMSKLETSNRSLYGYKLFGDAYRPHITLASYRERKELYVPTEKSFYQFDFAAQQLTVAESDNFGSVVRILDKIRLQ